MAIAAINPAPLRLREQRRDVEGLCGGDLGEIWLTAVAARLVAGILAGCGCAGASGAARGV